MLLIADGVSALLTHCSSSCSRGHTAGTMTWLRAFSWPMCIGQAHVHRTGPRAREITGPVVSSDTEGLQGDYLGFLTLLWDNFEACSAQGPSGPQWVGDPLLHGGSCSLTYPIVSPFPSCLTSPHPCRLFLGSPSNKTLCPQTYASGSALKGTQ